jgi:hypothetical protein
MQAIREEDDKTGRSPARLGGTTMVVTGTLCTVSKGRAEVVSAYAPPINSLCIRILRGAVWYYNMKYTSDNTFVPRVPQADEGTGPGAVKQAYAMCQGCFERGWHREETEVSAVAFGMDPSTPANYVQACGLLPAESAGVGTAWRTDRP